MPDNSLIIKIGASTKEFTDELEKAKKKIQDFDDGVTEIAKVSGVAFGALVGTIGLSVHAFGESEASSNALTQSLKTQGIFSRDLIDSYKEQAASLQDLTGVDDDAIIKGQSVLQGFLGQTKISKELTSAVLDLASAQGIDVQSAFELVGKAASSNTNILARYGIEVDNTGTKEEKLASITNNINAKFQGQAAAANEGLGSIKGLRSAFSDLAEEFGSHFAPAIEFGIKTLTSFFQEAKKHEVLITLAAVLTGIATAFAGVIAAASSVGVIIAALTPVVAALGLSFGGIAATLAVLAGPIGVLIVAITALGVAVASTTKGLDVKNKTAQELSDTLTSLRAEQDKLTQSTSGPFYNGDLEAQKVVRLKTIKDQIAQIEAAQTKLDKQAESGAQSQAKKDDQRSRTLAAEASAQEAIILETSNASKEIIDLKKQEAEILKQIADDKNKKIRELLEQNLADTKLLETRAGTEDVEIRKSFGANELSVNSGFNKLKEDQQKVFLLQNKQGLLASIETEQSVKDKALKESFNKEIDFNNKLLENREKFGNLIGSVATVINFKAVLEFAQTGVNAINSLASFPDTVKGATDEAIAKEAALSDARTKDVESEFAARKQNVDLALERGQIDQKNHDQRIADINEDRSNGLKSIEEQHKKNQAAIDKETAAKEEQAKAQQAAAGILADGAGKLADEVLPGIGGLVTGIVDLSAKGSDQARAAIQAFTDGFSVVLVTILNSLPAIIVGLSDAIGPLLTAIFTDLGPLIGNLLAGLGEGIDKIVIGVVDSVFKLLSNIDKIVDQVIDGFFKGIDKIFEKLPDIANKLAELMPVVAVKLSELMPEVSTKFTIAFIEHIPQIVEGLVKAVVEGEVNGILSGFEHVINGFADILNKTKLFTIDHVTLPRLHLAEGGIVGGGITGQDSVPALLTPGELVIPADKTPSVLNALYSKVASFNGSNQVGPQSIQIEIGFSSVEAEKILTAKQVEARAIGVFRS